MLSKTLAKYIQSLDQKKFRDQYGAFVAESPKLVLELLQKQNHMFRLIAALPEWLEEHDHLLAKVNVEEIIPVQAFELEKVSNLKHAHSVLAVVYKNPPAETDLNGKLSLALDEIQDPGNMGTILRIADWFGIENIICSPACVDIYNPKVIQATMGSIMRVNVVYRDLNELFTEYASLPVFAAMLEGENVLQMKTAANGILLIGNEGHGISNSLHQFISQKITIPRFGQAESLNAAVATGIILSHLGKG